MPSHWHKVKKMPKSESTMKTPPSTTKRFHFSMLVNQVLKIFVSSNHDKEEESPNPKNFFVLPSISVTSPEGQTTVVE